MGYQTRTERVLGRFKNYAWVGAMLLLPTMAIAGADFTMNYSDGVSGWTTSSPLIQEIYTSVALLKGYMDKLEMLFEHFDEVPFYVVMPTLEETIKDIQETCHNCKHPEFKMMLENGLLNKATALALEMKRRGKSERAIQIFSELKDKFREVEKEYKRVGAVVSCYSYSVMVR